MKRVLFTVAATLFAFSSVAHAAPAEPYPVPPDSHDMTLERAIWCAEATEIGMARGTLENAAESAADVIAYYRAQAGELALSRSAADIREASDSMARLARTMHDDPYIQYGLNQANRELTQCSLRALAVMLGEDLFLHLDF